MSSRSGKTPIGRVARLTRGPKTAVQQGRSSAIGVVEPEQLSGPRARTRIRPGVTTPRSAVMEAVSVGIDVSKRELMIAVHPTGEQWTTATTPVAIGTVVTRLRALAPQIIVVEATGGDESAGVAAVGGGGVAGAGGDPRPGRGLSQAVGRPAEKGAGAAPPLA